MKASRGRMRTANKQIMVRKGEIGMTGDILTATEVAGRLRVSLPWLYKQIKAGVIPHLKVGGVIRFRESDLNNWMDANKIENQKQ